MTVTLALVASILLILVACAGTNLLLTVYALETSPVREMRGIRALFAGHASRWDEYNGALQRAFRQANLDVTLSTDETSDPSQYDYIIYSPNGPVVDFSPFSNAKAVLNLWAGVEGVAKNPTLPPSIPLCRMVDPGLKDGMVEYVVGHTLRYHLGTDALWECNRQKAWAQSESGESMNALAQERTVGMMGMGELGSACAKALTNLNFQVLGWCRRDRPQQGIIECCYGEQGLKRVLRESDILVLLLPNTPETADIINRKTLSQCKQGVSIINAGRGMLIDDEALLDALDSGKVSGATLDVFKVEPLPEDHRFWSHPRVLVTPHIAAKTRSETAATVIAENIRRAENGESLLYVVDRDSGY